MICNCGFVQSELDPCLFLLKDPETKKLVGVFSLYVDNSISGGAGPIWERSWTQLQEELPFTRVREGKEEFVGSHLRQDSDFSISNSHVRPNSFVE